MDKTEIEKILQGLDKQLALGRIDLETYKDLKTRYSSMQGQKDIITKTMNGLSKELEMLNCPACMAPLPEFSMSGQVIVCSYCGNSFALKTAEEDALKLREDIKKWISEMSGQNTHIDTASRKFVFEERVYPYLCLLYRRVSEPFELNKYKALFNFPLLKDLKNSHNISSLEINTVAMQDLLNRVQSPELMTFVVTHAEKAKLRLLEINTQEIGHIVNIRRHFTDFSRKSLQIIKNNLEALKKLYSNVLLFESADNPTAKFYKGMTKRMGSLLRAVTALENALWSNVFDLDLKDIIKDLQDGLDLIESSGLESKYSIPAISGIKADIEAIKIFDHCVGIYKMCDSVDFNQFLSTITGIAGIRTKGISDMNGFLGSLNSHISSIRGALSLPVCKDHRWKASVIKKNMKSSFFGGKEYLLKERSILVPFWIAELSFSTQSGLFIKSGSITKAFVLQDASIINGKACLLLPSESLYKQCSSAFSYRDFLNTDSIVPIIDKNTALSKMSDFIKNRHIYNSGSLRSLGLVYLPAVNVCFKNKNSVRSLILFNTEKISYEGSRTVSHNLGSIDLHIIQ